MKKSRDFRPMLQPLEERIVLSFSLTGLIHSLLPFIKFPEKKPVATAHTHAPGDPEGGRRQGRAPLYGTPGQGPFELDSLEATGSTKVVSTDKPFSGLALTAVKHPLASRASGEKK